MPALQSPLTLGMYDDPSTGVQVGDINLRPQRDGYIWIERSSGEGMEVPVSLLESALIQFYGEHF
jgi:hypothetical protein